MGSWISSDVVDVVDVADTDGTIDGYHVDFSIRPNMNWVIRDYLAAINGNAIAFMSKIKGVWDSRASFDGNFCGSDEERCFWQRWVRDHNTDLVAEFKRRF